MYRCRDFQEQPGWCREDKRVRQSKGKKGKKRTVEYRGQRSKIERRYPNLGADSLDPTIPFRAGAERFLYAFITTRLG